MICTCLLTNKKLFVVVVDISLPISFSMVSSPSVEEISDVKHQSISLEQSNEGSLDFIDEIHDFVEVAPECSKISCSEYSKAELEVEGFLYDSIWLEGTH